MEQITSDFEYEPYVWFIILKSKENCVLMMICREEVEGDCVHGDGGLEQRVEEGVKERGGGESQVIWCGSLKWREERRRGGWAVRRARGEMVEEGDRDG